MIVRQFLHWCVPHRLPSGPTPPRRWPGLSSIPIFRPTIAPPPRRADHAARRSIAAGADRPGQGARLQRILAAAGDPRARRRPARGGELGARASAAAGRCRSGRCGCHRPLAGAGRDRQPRRLAERRVRRDRRGRGGGGLPDRERAGRDRAVLARPDRRPLRHLAAVREAMLARDDLPAATRRDWSPSCPRRSPASSRRANGWEQDHARRVAKEACEKDRHARGGVLRRRDPAADRHPRESAS